MENFLINILVVFIIVVINFLIFSRFEFKLFEQKKIQTYKFNYNYMLSIFVLLILFFTVNEGIKLNNSELHLSIILILLITLITFKNIKRKND